MILGNLIFGCFFFALVFGSGPSGRPRAKTVRAECIQRRRIARRRVASVDNEAALLIALHLGSSELALWDHAIQSMDDDAARQNRCASTASKVSGILWHSSRAKNAKTRIDRCVGIYMCVYVCNV